MTGMTDRAYFAIAVAIYGLCSVYAFFLWRRGFRRDERVSYLLLLTAFAFHTTAMFQRGFSLSSCPVNNLYEAITFTLWSITTAYLGIGLWRRFRFVGAFAAPVLFCLGVFALFPELDQKSPEPDFLKGWSSLHASLILLAYGAFGLASVAGAMQRTAEMGEVPSHWMIYMAVEDVDASAAKAAELGGQIVHPPTEIPNVGRWALIADPVGAMFAVMKLG